jgi:hypothetical protein
MVVARDLPASGYALEVDGRLKAEFATRDGAETGAEELKKRFPMLRIRIYDAQTQTREDVELTRGLHRLGEATAATTYVAEIHVPMLTGTRNRMASEKHGGFIDRLC